MTETGIPAPLPERKPAVQILARGAAARLDPVLWGLEEEGIPALVGDAGRVEDAEALAFEAARMSALNVGIGLDAAAAVLYHRDLPAGRPLFRLDGARLTPPALRRLGLNAARLVKGDPLELGAVAAPASVAAGGQDPQDLIERIVREVVDQLLKRSAP